MSRIRLVTSGPPVTRAERAAVILLVHRRARIKGFDADELLDALGHNPAVARRRPRVGVAGLVDVDEDGVPLARDLGERRDRVADVPGHAVAQARPLEERFALRDVGRVAVGRVHLAPVTHGPRHPRLPVIRTPEPRAPAVTR